MLVLFVIIEHDRSRSGVPNTPLDMEYDNNRTKESTAIALIITNHQSNIIHEQIAGFDRGDTVEEVTIMSIRHKLN